MSSAEYARRKADELLKLATATRDLAERSRLITEATHWHMKALAAHSAEPTPPADGTIIPFPDDPEWPEPS